MPKPSLLAKIFLYLIASWVLVHLFAVFGFFAAVAFSTWSIFDPKQSTCFLCRFGKKSEICRFCKKAFSSGLSRGYITILSILVNSVLILFITLFSVGAVFLETKALSRLGFPLTNKSVSFVIPSHGQYRLNEVFSTKIEIAGIEQPINLVQADLSFDPNILEVVSVSTKDSFASIFVQKEIDNDSGYVRLTGGLPNPGFSSNRGEFFTIFFKGKVPGPVELSFLPTSMVLANDGHGTNVVKDLASVSYLILSEEYQESAGDQKEVSFQSSVLGVEAENTQMIFYEEEKVLGSQVSDEVKKSKFKLKILERISDMDEFILSFWMSLKPSR